MLTVMIVDDMDITRREMKRLKLWGERSGFIISDEAKNGSEALVKLEVNTVDLVITDVKMPKVDGIELLGKLMEKHICSCVVLLSDYSDFSYVRQGLVLGAFDYLRKPVNEEEFEKLLHRAKEFILGKRREEERVKELEAKLGEKVEVYFPKTDVNQIIDLISRGDEKAVDAAGRIVDAIGVHMDNEVIKVESVLKRIILEMTKSMLQKYPWLDKFINLSELENMDFTHCHSIENQKSVFMGIVRKVVFTINTLISVTSENGIVNQVCSFVLENVDMNISLSTVADKLFMNKTYISETFKQKTGVSFIEYLKTAKMERAKRLLTEGKLKTYEIAEKLGYRDIEYFSKLFKAYTGVTPTNFRIIYTKKDN